MRRVLVDTNVIISALSVPGSTPAPALERVMTGDRLVLTQWIIGELHQVVQRKRPHLIRVLDELLASLEHEIATPGSPRGTIADLTTSRSWTQQSPVT